MLRRMFLLNLLIMFSAPVFLKSIVFSMLYVLRTTYIVRGIDKTERCPFLEINMSPKRFEY
jgi:hypothetical protein